MTLTGSLAKNTDLDQVKAAISIRKAKSLADGTAANQANEYWSDTRVLAATSESLDLEDGTLANAMGDTITLSKMKLLYIHNKSTTAGEDLTLSGNATPMGGTTPTITIEPDGWFFWSSPIDGKAIASSTADTLTLNSGSDTITYDIIIAGVT